MVIEAKIRNALLPIAPDRVFPDFAPESALNGQPFITYTQVGGRTLGDIENDSEVRNGRFQINVWANSRLTANTMIRQAEMYLKTNSELRAVPLMGAAAVYDEPTSLYGAHQAFSIWFR